MTSAVALARDLYSASVLDRDTVGCFLALQEIKFGPKYMANPQVDLLSSTFPAQSASENALTSLEPDLLIYRPISMEPLTYLRILLTALQCTVVGA
jgi:hypothetical protein